MAVLTINAISGLKYMYILVLVMPGNQKKKKKNKLFSDI